MSSVVVEAKDLYLALGLEEATVICFFELHDIKFSLRKMQ